MSFNLGFVNNALYAAFATKNTGDILKFPDVDPVFSNGASIAAAPSLANVTGIPIATYELRERYIFMKYAFTEETLALAGLSTDAVFQERMKSYFQSEYQTYIQTLVVPGTVYQSPSSTSIVYEFSNIIAGTTPTKVARAYVLVKYWFKLP